MNKSFTIAKPLIFVTSCFFISYNSMLSVSVQQANEMVSQAQVALTNLENRHANSKRDYENKLLDFQRRSERFRVEQANRAAGYHGAVGSEYRKRSRAYARASDNYRIGLNIIKYGQHQWFPKRDEINRAQEHLNKMIRLRDEAIHIEKQRKKQEAIKQRTIQEEQVLNAPPKIAQPVKPRPLRYGTLIILGARSNSGSDAATWKNIWTHTFDRTYTNNHNALAAPLELLVGAPDNRPNMFANLLQILKADDLNSSKEMRYGDQIEIRSMYSAAGFGQDHLGHGRIWWANDEDNADFENYPYIVVSPKNDPGRPKTEKFPRTQTGRQSFIIESLVDNRTGKPVLENDFIRLKVSPKHPTLAGKYVWTHSNSQHGSAYHQLRIAGPQGVDRTGIQMIGKDRSTTPRNQFIIKKARQSKINPTSDFTLARMNLPHMLPKGTVIALQTVHGKYLQTVGNKIRADAPNASQPAAQFEIDYQAQGWMGLKNKYTQTYLQGSVPPRIYGNLFANKEHTFWHWMFDGDMSRAYLRNEISHRFIGAKPDGSVTMSPLREGNQAFKIEVISRPTPPNTPQLYIMLVNYGTREKFIDFTKKIRTELKKQGDTQLFLTTAQVKTLLSDPQLSIKQSKDKKLMIRYAFAQQKYVDLFTADMPINIVSLAPAEQVVTAKQETANQMTTQQPVVVVDPEPATQKPTNVEKELVIKPPTVADAPEPVIDEPIGTLEAKPSVADDPEAPFGTHDAQEVEQSWLTSDTVDSGNFTLPDDENIASIYE